MMKTYKVALIGYGDWGKMLLYYLDQFFDVKHVFGRSIKKEGRFTNDLEAVWSSDVDAVVVATPIGTHYEIVSQALAYNKNVFCEKPLTTDPSLAIALNAIVKEKGLEIVTDYTYTFSKRLENVQNNIIGIRGIGELRTISLEMNRKTNRNKWGVYWELASHLLAILDMFVDIKTLNFYRVNLADKKKGSILFGGKIGGEIFVDSTTATKETTVVFSGTRGQIVFSHLHDAENNLEYAMRYFRDVLDGKIDNKMNIERAISITDTLKKLDDSK